MTDRSVPPKYTPPKKILLPRPEIVEFDNGSRFFFLKAGEQPVIKLEFIFRAGTWFESEPGVAFFTAKMLPEGTESFSSKVIAEKLDQFGAFVEINPGFDYTNIAIHIPTRHFDKIKSVVYEMLFQPTFPEVELELMKQIQIQQLKINEQKNKFVASRMFRSSLYRKLPYSHVMTEESINSISVDNLKNHFEKYIKGKFDILLTGSFSADFKSQIQSSFELGLLSVHPFESISFDPVDNFSTYIERKESVQSSIFMGRRCVNRDHEQYAGFLLLNEVFGGYFGSRLMQNIREDKGLTYSIYSHPVSLKNDAYFVISSDVNKEKKDLVIDEIHNEISKIKTEKIGEEELLQAKNYLKGSIVNSLTTPFALSEKLKNIYFYGLGMDFYDKLFDQIDEMTSEKLLYLANNLVFDQPFSSVIVG